MISKNQIVLANQLIQKLYGELSIIQDKHSDDYRSKTKELKDLRFYISLALDNTCTGQDAFFREETLNILEETLNILSEKYQL